MRSGTGALRTDSPGCFYPIFISKDKKHFCGAGDVVPVGVDRNTVIKYYDEIVTELQQELADAKEENTTRYNVVMDSVNLEEVRDRAINDLGMGYATSDQIIEYQNPVNDYVKQYESIPKSGVLGQTTDK